MKAKDGFAHPDRLHALDWLRVLSILWVVVWHAGVVIAPDAPTVGALAQAGPPWRMPLVFAVAGIAATMTLQRQGARRWLRLRLRRLLWPLSLGLLILVPLSLHLGERVPRRADWSGGWSTIASEFYAPLYDGGIVRWNHLWFIAYLAVFAIAGLPVVRWRAHRAGSGSLAARIAVSPRLTGRLVLYAPSLALIAIACVRDRWATHLSLFGTIDFRLFASSLLVYLCAVCCTPGSTGWATMLRHRREALLAGALLVAGAVALRHVPELTVLPRAARGAAILDAGSAWLGVSAILGFSGSYLPRANRLLAMLRDLSFPVYLLHWPIMLAVAPEVRQLGLSGWAAFALLLAVTLVASLSIGEYLGRGYPVAALVLGTTVRRTERPLPAGSPPVKIGTVPSWLSTEAIVRARTRRSEPRAATDPERPPRARSV